MRLVRFPSTRSRPSLASMCYPLVFFDAIRVKIRDGGFVRNKAAASTSRPSSTPTPSLVPVPHKPLVLDRRRQQPFLD